MSKLLEIVRAEIEEAASKKDKAMRISVAHDERKEDNVGAPYFDAATAFGFYEERLKKLLKEIEAVQ